MNDPTKCGHDYLICGPVEDGVQQCYGCGHFLVVDVNKDLKILSIHKENPKMENQHQKIKGYRDLSQEEIDLMNEIKVKGVELGELVAKLRATEGLDQRWVSIGATDLQTGLMALTRGVAQPTSF